MRVTIQVNDEKGQVVEVGYDLTVDAGQGSLAEAEALVWQIRQQVLPQVEKALVEQAQAGFKGEKNR
jgi:hypothetical protein